MENIINILPFHIGAKINEMYDKYCRVCPFSLQNTRDEEHFWNSTPTGKDTESLTRNICVSTPTAKDKRHNRFHLFIE